MVSRYEALFQAMFAHVEVDGRVGGPGPVRHDVRPMFPTMVAAK
jgi:hypothetical protein